MDLKQLRYFVAVAEAGHITRAAAQLGIQQPPLSQMIKSLEESLGTTLFKRHPKGVTLTESGEMLLADSRRLLEDAQAIKLRMRAVAAGHAGVLNVGFTSSAAAHAFTPRVLRECRRAHPGIALQVTEDHAAGITEALALGRLHCGFLRVPVARPEGIVFETLLREEVLVALPVDHALLARAGKSLSLKQLRGESFIFVRQAGAPGLYANLLAKCEQQGFTPRVGHEVGRMMTALSLVAAGQGVAVVPASMRGAHAQSIEYRSLKDASSLDAPLTLAYRQGDASAALRSFVSLVHRHAAREKA